MKVAVLTGASTLSVVFAIGYFVQTLMFPGNGNLGYSHLFWLESVAAPLTLATVLGVFISRAKKIQRISTAKLVIIITATPLIAFLSFLFMYLVILAFYNHAYTSFIVVFILALAHGFAIVVVRFFVNILCGAGNFGQQSD